MRTLVMGVLNVTPDSFSDGGRWMDPEAAVARGLAMLAEGADIIDVGGESSRPGAIPVDQATELSRVVPVITELARHARVSVDTAKASVAEAAVAAGASLINDISASLAPVAAAGGVGWVAMHMRATPATMQQSVSYADVVGEVCHYLAGRAAWATDLGVGEIWIDPGIGFAKTSRHNLELLRHLSKLVGLGFPVVIGTSRKSFLGPLSSLPGEAPAGVEDRLEASLATAVWCAERGAAMVRVHDVKVTVSALALAGHRRDRLLGASSGAAG